MGEPIFVICGLAGTVITQEFAEKGRTVVIWECKDHIDSYISVFYYVVKKLICPFYGMRLSSTDLRFIPVYASQEGVKTEEKPPSRKVRPFKDISANNGELCKTGGFLHYREVFGK